jgi:hypothetical protein
MRQRPADRLERKSNEPAGGMAVLVSLLDQQVRRNWVIALSYIDIDIESDIAIAAAIAIVICWPVASLVGPGLVEAPGIEGSRSEAGKVDTCSHGHSAENRSSASSPYGKLCARPLGTRITACIEPGQVFLHARILDRGVDQLRKALRDLRVAS